MGAEMPGMQGIRRTAGQGIELQYRERKT